MVSDELAVALRAAGVTDVDTSSRRRAEYSSDASNYRVVPALSSFRVMPTRSLRPWPSPTSTVSAHQRGAGTSTAGNSVGPGIVLDFSRHLNRVLSIDPEARTASVEPGAILDDITAAASVHALRFGPDPSTHARATIGGSIGNNACGSRALRYGRTADNVVALDVLTAGGTQLSARAFGRDGLGAAGPIGAELQRIVDRERALIRTEFGRFRRQVSGYSLEHLLPENGADLAKFLVGTEGTLAVLTRATVASGRVAARGRACRAGLPGHAGGRRGRARAAAARTRRARGHGRPPRRGRAEPPWGRGGARAAARRRLAVRRDVGRDAEDDACARPRS